MAFVSIHNVITQRRGGNSAEKCHTVCLQSMTALYVPKYILFYRGVRVPLREYLSSVEVE